MPDVAASGERVGLFYDGKAALAPSDFEIPAGGLTAVIGPNGSGKSTLLSALAGLLVPRRGRLRVLGEDPRRIHRRVSYVLQGTRVNEVMPVTVREVIGMGRYAKLGPFRAFGVEDRAAVTNALERLDLIDIASSHLTELSGGQRQRVFVAQGLVQEAELLLLDEPLTGLDVVSRQHIVAAVTDELEEGRTAVITTHDLAEAGGADHVLLLAGRVVASGTPEDVLGPDRLSEAYGVGILHLEDGTVALDDPHHRATGRHVHFGRARDQEDRS